MKIIRRHKRCPQCGSFKTRKNGFIFRHRHTPDRAKIKFVRWLCLNCHKSFSQTHSLHGFTHAKEASELYFDAKASYRNVAKVLGLHKMTAYAHIQAACQRAKAPSTISLECKPAWSGYLALDSDTLRVFKSHEHLILGVDIGTRDIPNAWLVRTESLDNWTTFLKSFQDLGYPLKAIVSDGDPIIVAAIHAVFPDIPHQLCVRHFHNDMFRFLRYRPHRKPVDMPLTKLFLAALHKILYANSLDDYHFFLRCASAHPTFQHPDLHDAFSKLRASYKYLVPHFLDKSIPRTSNIVENVISQLDLKINPIIKFQSHETAWSTLKLLISWYRFKPFSACRKRHIAHNGFSPLQLAGVSLNNNHWIFQATTLFKNTLF